MTQMGRALILCSFLLAPCTARSGLCIKPVVVEDSSSLKIEFMGGTNDYYRLLEATSLTQQFWSIRNMCLGMAGMQSILAGDVLKDMTTGFYRLQTLALLNPGDADGDLMDDVYELRSPVLNPLDDADATGDADGDALINVKEYELQTLAEQVDSDSDGMDDGWEYYIGDGTNDSLPPSGVNRLWLYHGNTAYTDPLTEPVPGLPATFLSIDPAGGTNTLHFLAPQRLALGGQEMPVLEFHYACLEPDTWEVKADEWLPCYLCSNTILKGGEDFHGLPTLGAVTLDVYRVDFPIVEFMDAAYIWYSVLAKSEDINGQQIDYTYLLEDISADWGSPGYGANNWRVGPQLYGADSYNRDYLVRYDAVGLRNGGFEEGASLLASDLTHWHELIFDSAHPLVSTTTVHGGGRSLVLTNWAAGLWQSFGVLPGREIVLTGHMMMPVCNGELTGMETGVTSLEFYDRHGSLLGNRDFRLSITNNPGLWHVFSITSIVPDHARSCNVSLSENLWGNTSVYFDDLAIFQAEDSDVDGIPDYQELRMGLNSHEKRDGFGDADGDGLSNAREYQLGANAFVADSDGDGFLDAWEVAHGYEPTGEDDAALDSDSDGLLDVEEYQLGVDPFSRDSDRDGLPDKMEVCVFKSDPARPDFGGFETTEVMPAYRTSATLGEWRTRGLDLLCDGLRGRADYEINISTAGIYRVEVTAFDHGGYLAKADFDMIVSVDSQQVRRITIETEEGNPASAGCFLPWLASGSHTISLYWDNGFTLRKLGLRSLRLQTIAGDDTDDNGRKDWEDDWLACTCSVEWPLHPVHTSPLCLEGRGGYPGMMSLTGNAMPWHGVGERWFADIPLTPTGNTAIAVTFQNGGQIFSNTVVWTPLNLLCSEDLLIRCGDTLKMSAHPEGVTQGVYSITIVGVTNYIGSPVAPSTCTFDLAGSYTLDVTHSYSTTVSNQLTVDVVDGRFGDDPVVWKGRMREWVCPDMPPNVIVDADPRLQLEERDPVGGPGRRFQLTIDQNEPRYIAARLRPGGPIVDVAECTGIEILSGGQTYARFVDSLEDGSRIVETMIVQSPLRNDVTIRMEIFVGGILFEDGSWLKELIAYDFNELGECPVRFIYAHPVMSSICHKLKAYQNGELIGVR